ncbi:MAG: dihydroorotate dehydrogenase electron transfer subunit [Solirubrobacteraceae bacterium]
MSTDARRVTAPFQRRTLDVTRNEALGPYRLLWARDDGPAPHPGQFAMIAAASRWGGGAEERPYLARACSIARRLPHGECAFLLEDVGPGTARLCELRRGEALTVLGPLGNGFSRAPAGRELVLVGGGVGIAPLAILQDSLRDSTPRVLLGFRDAAHAQAAMLLRDAQLATDDGSVGHHGRVTELLEQQIETGDPLAVRACGPPAMLEAVRALCVRHGVPAELALEASMACGFGSCYGCAAPRAGGGYLRVCLDGPVVDAAELACVR